MRKCFLRDGPTRAVFENSYVSSALTPNPKPRMKAIIQVVAAVAGEHSPDEGDEAARRGERGYIGVMENQNGNYRDFRVP